MAFMQVRMEVIGPLARGRRWWGQQVLKPSFHKVGLWWRTILMPKRFDSRQGAYRFQDRSLIYKAAKRAQGKGTTKLVFKGDAKRLAKRGRVVARATSTRQSVRVSGPRKLNLRPKTKKGRRPPNMAQEYRAFTGREVRQIKKQLKRFVMNKLRFFGSRVRFTTQLTRTG